MRGERTGRPGEESLFMRPIKTFLVEDSPVIRESLIATLEELTSLVVVGSAPDEMASVQWLRDPGHEVDLVIVDIFLKSGTGLEVLRHARTLQPGAQRVVLTNYATPDMRRRCAELGAHRVFDKSAELEELLAFCAELVPDASAH